MRVATCVPEYLRTGPFVYFSVSTLGQRVNRVERYVGLGVTECKGCGGADALL